MYDNIFINKKNPWVTVVDGNLGSNGIYKVNLIYI